MVFLVFAFEDFLFPDDGVEDGFVTREEESLIPFVGSLAVLFFEVRLVVVVVVVVLSLAVEEICAVLCSVVLDPLIMVTLEAADLALDFALDLDGEVVSLWISFGERCVTGLCCVCS